MIQAWPVNAAFGLSLELLGKKASPPGVLKLETQTLSFWALLYCSLEKSHSRTRLTWRKVEPGDKERPFLPISFQHPNLVILGT